MRGIWVGLPETASLGSAPDRALLNHRIRERIVIAVIVFASVAIIAALARWAWIIRGLSRGKSALGFGNAVFGSLFVRSAEAVQNLNWYFWIAEIFVGITFLGFGAGIITKRDGYAPWYLGLDSQNGSTYYMWTWWGECELSEASQGDSERKAALRLQQPAKKEGTTATFPDTNGPYESSKGRNGAHVQDTIIGIWSIAFNAEIGKPPVARMALRKLSIIVYPDGRRGFYKLPMQKLEAEDDSGIPSTFSLDQSPVPFLDLLEPTTGHITAEQIQW
ncbi:hypothetical protein R3P38DRAFT_2808813 [Favolaschia claudopus]|uniref:Uncharacterized protein n=1 Tax=Favolaschia claudopus TaxID=2862362 RepID=A0AAV9ZEL8_9AGAR